MGRGRTMPPPGGGRLVAVDGKTLRGSSSVDKPGRHLLAALDFTHGVVLSQVEVAAKTNEIPCEPGLLFRDEPGPLPERGEPGGATRRDTPMGPGM
jgi:hypothetical protein